MQATAESKRIAKRSYKDDIHWLHVNMLRRLAGVGLVIGGAWWVILTALLEIFDLQRWPGPLALLSGSLLTILLLDRGSSRSSLLVYLGSVTLSIPLAAWGYADASLLVLLALPVGIVCLLLGSRAGLVAATIVSIMLRIISLQPAHHSIPLSIVWLTSVLSFTTALLLWVAMYPIHTTVQWAWAGYEQAREQAERLRDQRGKLNQTIRDLHTAYDRLETMTFELERARRAAEEARRLKAEFAANVSHELRTPLNLIIGYSEMLAMSPHVYNDQPLPPALQADVLAIYRNAQHLSNLINDVLDLSQIEAGRMGLQREPVAIAEVTAEALNAVAHLFEIKGLTVTTNVPSHLPTVQADRTRIRQVLINLLNNASRFTDSGGVTITATADERDITVQVTDTGIGIAEEDLPKVFEQFRQLDGSTRRRTGGSGLGLAISNKFIEMHGGRMWVKSKLGQGTTFYFTLPIREELGIRQLPPEWETWARAMPARSSERTIVVVSKDAATVALFQRYLDGFRVLGASDGEEARRLAAREPIDSLVLVTPSTEAGRLELQRAWETLPSLPLAICTLNDGIKAPLHPNIQAYLVKPISRVRFLEALEGLGEQVHNLLIVDDNPEVVDLLARMVTLASRPYHVTQSYDGTQALEIMRRRRIEAIVLDLIMPTVDGQTVLEHMQADRRLRSIPVIIVTAKGQEKGTITAELVGFSQRDGFSIGQMMRCLKAGVDSLRPPVLAYTEPTKSAASPV